MPRERSGSRSDSPRSKMTERVPLRSAAFERQALRRVRAAIRRNGFLLFTDAREESVVGLVAGAPVRGSWFAHPASHQIYHVGETLELDRDLLALPLLDRKSTFVHRRFWPPVLAIAKARSPWQMSGLSPSARILWNAVEKAGILRIDRLPALPLARNRRPGDLARDLERRLLVHGRSVHTETGRHTKLLESWHRWMRRRRFARVLPPEPIARRQVEDQVRARFPDAGSGPRLPWQT
jgi:hypothetical protein